jgi:hypothetical protein
VTMGWKYRGRPISMPDQSYPVFDIVLKQRGRGWRWRVLKTNGDLVMEGSEKSRPAARYEANRALLLLLLSAPYQRRTSELVPREAPTARKSPLARSL